MSRKKQKQSRKKRTKSPQAAFDFRQALDDLGFADVEFEAVGKRGVLRVTYLQDPDDAQFVRATAFQRPLKALLRDTSDTDDDASWWERFWVDMPTCDPPAGYEHPGEEED